MSTIHLKFTKYNIVDLYDEQREGEIQVELLMGESTVVLLDEGRVSS